MIVDYWFPRRSTIDKAAGKVRLKANSYEDAVAGNKEPLF
jgi:hypothetical protein